MCEFCDAQLSRETNSGSDAPYSVVDKSVAIPPTSVSIRFTQLFINGRFVESNSGQVMDVFSPLTNATDRICTVSAADVSDVDRAVKAARSAYSSTWSRTSGAERGRLLNRLADLVELHGEELAALDCLDAGKPFGMSLNYVDVPSTVKTLRYFAGWADKIQGKTIPVEGTYQSYTTHEPVGVVAAIIAWNYPLGQIGWKVGPVLSTGNTLVIKSSEKTPLTLLRFAALVKEAGFPDGVFNALSGGAEVGQALSSHMDVDKIVFTGSAEIGQRVLCAAATSNMKKVALDLGGKNCAIVFPDADCEAAVSSICQSAMFNAGQSCSSVSRVLVHDSIYERFTQMLTKAVASQPTTNQVNTMYGLMPLIDQQQHTRVLNHIEQGKQAGAQLVTGGTAGDLTYIAPTLFKDVTDDMSVAREEIFGPVLCASSFSTIDEVIARTNSTRFGLAASVWTRDSNKATFVANQLQVGTVWLNCHNVFNAGVPFGGYKQSGMGRELSEYALTEYTQVKAITSIAPNCSSSLKLNILE